MRKHGRLDTTQKPLVAYAKAHGASWWSTANLGDNGPDGILGIHGHDFKVEFKSEKGALSPGQSEWIKLWRGSPVRILRTTEDVDRLLSTVLPNKRAPKRTTLGAQEAVTP